MHSLRPILLVGLGGGVGSIGRYLLTSWVHRALPLATFPYGTLLVNVAGCLAIGLLGGLFEQRQLGGPELRLFLLVGILGGFTTFSSFAYDTLTLARDVDFGRALLNIAAQLLLGLPAAWLGYTLVRAFAR